MRLQPMIPRPCRALAATVVVLLLGAVFPVAVEADPVAKRDLRDARAAVREGRLEDALDAYERVLQSTATDKNRFESLYNTVLILLASGPDAAADVVKERLTALGLLVDSGEESSELEIRALAALVGNLHAVQATAEERERKLVLVLSQAEQASAGQRRATAEALAAQELLVGAERRERLLVERRIEELERHLETREDELDTRVGELGRCTSELQLVLDQLAGTHQSEVQMLQVVMRKNEELAAAERALQKQEKELADQARQLALKAQEQADQAKQLEAKEEEIRKREEVIREVTERVLGKDPPDS